MLHHLEPALTIRLIEYMQNPLLINSRPPEDIDHPFHLLGVDGVVFWVVIGCGGGGGEGDAAVVVEFGTREERLAVAGPIRGVADPGVVVSGREVWESGGEEGEEEDKEVGGDDLHLGYVKFVSE